jgi:hypothetical protein
MQIIPLCLRFRLDGVFQTDRPGGEEMIARHQKNVSGQKSERAFLPPPAFGHPLQRGIRCGPGIFGEFGRESGRRHCCCGAVPGDSRSVVSVVSVKSVCAAPRGEVLRQWRFYLPRPSATPSKGGYAAGRVFSGNLAGSQVGDIAAAALCREGSRSVVSVVSVKSVFAAPQGKALRQRRFCLPRPSATPSKGGYAPGRVFSESLAGSQVGDIAAAALCREGSRSVVSVVSVKSVFAAPQGEASRQWAGKVGVPVTRPRRSDRCRQHDKVVAPGHSAGLPRLSGRWYQRFQ